MGPAMFGTHKAALAPLRALKTVCARSLTWVSCVRRAPMCRLSSAGVAGWPVMAPG
jgi:hypothetical protein